jgi:flagellar L-ring protein precursor FlgH
MSRGKPMKDSDKNVRCRFTLTALVVLGLILLGACSQMQKPPVTEQAEPTATAPVEQTPLPVDVHPVVHQPQTEGSLWLASGSMNGLFINPKARYVGDILTIKVIESSSATNQALTTTDRSSGLSAGLSGFFNAEKSFPVDHPFFNPFSKVSGSFESEFEGAGTTRRSGDLTAYITVRIVAVLPNGNLKIQGSREVTVNKEKQLITLIGVVRSRDISSENMVLSTYISDAQIIYDGVGIVNDRQKPGWLTGLLLKIWPF